MQSKNWRVQEKCNKRWQNHLRRKERAKTSKHGGKKNIVFEQNPYYANSFINLWQRGFQQPDGGRGGTGSMEGKKKSKSEGEKGNGVEG